MPDDYTLVFLGTLAAGLASFCLLSGYAYLRIRTYRRNIGQLYDRLQTVQKSLNQCHQDLGQTRTELDRRLSTADMDHSISLFSMHVLHHLPGGEARPERARAHAIKPALRRKTR